MQRKSRRVKTNDRAGCKADTSQARSLSRFAGSMDALLTLAVFEAVDPGDQGPSRALLADALALTGPLIFHRDLVRACDGKVEFRLARKPHRDRYRKAGDVRMPASIHARLEAVLAAQEAGR